MIIVGEKINTSRRNIAEAVEKRDAEFIGKVARDQAETGAHYIDVNAGTYVDEEVDCLCWLVETVQSEVNLPLCLDSPNPKALSEAIKRHKGEPMINSISLEKDRFLTLLSVVTSRPCKVVALCMAQTSIPLRKGSLSVQNLSISLPMRGFHLAIFTWTHWCSPFQSILQWEWPPLVPSIRS